MLVALVVVTSAVTASGAFSAAEADRNVTATVVDDPEAFLNVDTHDIEKTKTDKPDAIRVDEELSTFETEPNVLAAVLFVYEDIRIATIKNRFPTVIDPLNVSIETAEATPTVEQRDAPSALPPAEHGNVAVDVGCPIAVVGVDIGMLDDALLSEVLDSDDVDTADLDGHLTVDVEVLAPAETTATVDTLAKSADDSAAELSRAADVRCAFPGVVTIDLELDALPSELLEGLLEEALAESSSDEDDGLPGDVSDGGETERDDEDDTGVLDDLLG